MNFEIKLIDSSSYITFLSKEDLTQSWLSVGLTIIDFTLILVLFLRGI